MRTFLRTLGFLKTRKAWLILLVLGALLLAVFSLVEPIFFKEIINNLASFSDADTALSILGKIILLWIAVALVSMVVRILITFFADVMVHKIHIELWEKAIQKVLTLSIGFHNSKKTGSTMHKIERGTDNIFEILLDFLREDLPRIFLLLLLIPLIFFLHFKMALMLSLILPVILFLAIWGSTKTHKLQAQVEKKWTQASGSAFDAVANISVIKSFTAFGMKMGEISKLALSAHLDQLKVLKWWCFIIVIGRSASIIATIFVFAFGAYLNIHGEITIGEIVMFSGYALLVVNNVEAELWHFQKFLWRKSKMDQFYEIWDEVPSIQNADDAKELSDVKGAVEFKDVCFAHESGQNTLNNVSFKANSGKTVALVGHTGSGKTTTVNLLSRFFDIQSGQILIDGNDISKVTQESLRKNIGMVFQENLLFHESILDNLKIGNPNASMNQIKEACRIANIDDFIDGLPKKFDTIVGERGVKLSGGEKQRVSIARALLKNPPILVLDEATSALDSETEQKIQDALEHLIAGRTTFIVAHRLSTIKKADNILVFDKGRIVEQGKFTALMEKKGQFCRLVDAQVSGFII